MSTSVAAKRRVHLVDEVPPVPRLAAYGFQHVLAFYAGAVLVPIASLGNLARAGGLALRALGYFFVATVIALFLGLLAGNLVQPGAGFQGQPSQAQIDQATKSVETGGEESGVAASSSAPRRSRSASR